MKEQSDSLPQELIEYERFIEDLLNDTSHPLHNRAHPQHKDAVKALEELTKQADALREAWLLRN